MKNSTEKADLCSYKTIDIAKLNFALNPFKIAKLPGEEHKIRCPDCGESCLYFCRKCHKPFLDPEQNNALIESRPILPVPLGIIYFVGESLSKSSVPGVLSVATDIKLVTVATNVSAATKHNDAALSEIKDDMERFNLRRKQKQESFDNALRSEIEESSVILMPTEDAVSVEEIDWSKVARAYVVDCTWNQTHLITDSAVIKQMKKVKIQGRKTIFWRQHKQSFQGCVSSAECIYYLCKDIAEFLDKKAELMPQSNNGDTDQRVVPANKRNLDNLLFFFVVHYIVIQKNFLNKKFDQLTRKKHSEYSDAYKTDILQLERDYERSHPEL